MASTYSTNLAIELIGTGDQAGSWGNTTNTNLGTLIEQAISGYVTQAVSTGTDTTITIPNGATGVARNMYIELTGTGGASTNLIVPANKKLYFIFNNTSSGQVTVKVSGQTGVSVPNKAKIILVSNGTDVVDATNYIGNISAASANITVLTSASATITNLIATSASITTLTNNPTFSGGTANGVLYLNGSKVATSGSALTFDGTSFVAGVSAGAGQHIFRTYTSGGFAAIYNGAVTPGSTNYSFVTNATQTTLNAATFISGEVGGTEGMRLTSTGLGIGTSSPASKLHVSNTAAATRITITDDVAAGRSGYIESNYSDALVIGTTSGVRGIRFSPDNTPRMLLDTLGNLGIGTSSPSAKLSIAGNSSANITPDINITRSSSGTTIQSGPNITFVDGTTNNTISLQNTQGRFGVWNYGAGAWNERLSVDASGNLGLGVTPSAYGTRGFDIAGFVGLSQNSAGAAVLAFNNFQNGAGNYIYKTTNPAARYDCGLAGTAAHAWYIAASGTAGTAITFTQAMTLDASGNLGVGTASPVTNLHVYKTTAATSGVQISSANWGSTLTDGMFVGVDNNNSYVYTYENIPLVFGTNNTERARITAGGYSKFSNTGAYQDSAGSYHEFRSNGAAGEYTAIIGNSTSTDANAFGVRILYGNADPNGTGNQFLNCADWNGSSIVTRAEIRSNGGLANYQANNVDLSDARTKKDIIPAASMWGKVSALEIVTYKYNDQTHDDVNLGVIAQQVETVEPVWVDADGFGDTPEDGVPIKTVYTKDITFAAIKALQEAMARIEQLEAKVAALESK